VDDVIVYAISRRTPFYHKHAYTNTLAVPFLCVARVLTDTNGIICSSMGFTRFPTGATADKTGRGETFAHDEHFHRRRLTFL